LIKTYLKVATLYPTMFEEDPEARAGRLLTDAYLEVAKSNRYSDAAGLLRGLLFLSNKPVSLDELTEKTGYSKSTVSSNMSFLESQGLARRIVTPGDKRYHYVAITDPDLLKEALLCNLMKEIRIIRKAMTEAEKCLQEDKSDESKEFLTRITSIKTFYENTEDVLEILLHFSPDELLKILKSNQKPL